jgi:hypothetical protein
MLKSKAEERCCAETSSYHKQRPDHGAAGHSAYTGVRPGDRLLFESDSTGVRIRPLRAKSPFEKCRGIGNPGIPSGRKAVRHWVRELRGQ